jgi:hypothetical protein
VPLEKNFKLSYNFQTHYSYQLNFSYLLAMISFLMNIWWTNKIHYSCFTIPKCSLVWRLLGVWVPFTGTIMYMPKFSSYISTTQVAICWLQYENLLFSSKPHIEEICKNVKWYSSYFYNIIIFHENVIYVNM